MMSLKQVVKLTQGTLVGADTVFDRVVTDSRQVREGDLFVALKGERFDAHDFVADVLAKGAVAALVAHDYQHEDASLVKVADTRLALGSLAAGWAMSLPVRRVGITGSNGKTTVKEMVAAILRHFAGDEAVHATAGNFNNDIGLPLTLLGLNASHSYAVLELGMNHEGEMRYLSGLAKPEVALVNNAMRAHFGHFNSTEAVARAKAEIFEGLTEDGIAVLNADDPNSELFDRAVGTHSCLRFGFAANADITAENIVLGTVGSTFVLVTPQGRAEVALPAAGEHNVRNALAAAAIAVALNVPLTDIVAGLAAFTGAKGRLQYKQRMDGGVVIDDTYNANPDSMKAALDVLTRLPAPRWFVMGDIGELGSAAAALHAEVGAYAKAVGIDAVLVLGNDSREAAAAFGSGAHVFESIETLFAFLDSALPQHSSVLVKGSRFMRMERVVEHLLAVTQQREGN